MTENIIHFTVIPHLLPTARLVRGLFHFPQINLALNELSKNQAELRANFLQLPLAYVLQTFKAFFK